MTTSRGELTDFDVVISGGGPAGLATALEAMKVGKRVMIISDRSIIEEKEEKGEKVFSRGQRVSLDENSRRYLLSMFPNSFAEGSDDDRFFATLTQDVTIQVKDIERFFVRRIREEQQKDKDKASIEFMNNRTIDTVNMEQGQITVKGSAKDPGAAKRDITFHHLIGADGAKHHAVNVVNGGNPVIHYEKVPAPKHPYHASITFNITSKSGKPIKLSEQYASVQTKVGSEHYLAGLSLTEKKKGDSNEIKCVFSGEVSKDIFDKIQRLGILGTWRCTIT